ncbi:glycosyltransferase [Clostridium ihumii]|uniref:glycosyltransferase n=1 Tax=Clostridium ihumii TaxID=1470356 RepID=UPI003D33D0F0
MKNLNIQYKLFPKKVFNKEIVKYANDNNIDIINFHGAQPFLIHLFIKNKLKCETVATVHSDYRYDFLNSKIKYYMYTPLSELGLKSFDNYVTVSENLLKLLEGKNFNGNKSVINNGINVEKFIKRSTNEDIREKFKIGKDDFVLGVIARFHPIKNHENIIRAFSKFIKDNPKSKLLLLGDGENLKNIKKIIDELQINDYAIMPGFVENICDYIKICNATIIASYSEGGAPPLAMIESAVMSVPILSTKVGDLENMIKPNNGLIINSQNEKDIYIAMLECYDKKNNLEVWGKNIKTMVLENFTIEEFWKRYNDVYINIIRTKLN